MGFYGNITNTARTQFQFDRIFSSRQTMVEGQGTDGVYMGRYVLVEYDSDVQLDNLLRVQINRDGKLYYNPTGGTSFSTLLTQALADEKQIVYTYTEGAVPAYAFYIITSKKIVGSTEPAQYRKVVESDSNYVVNYNLDVSVFGEGRGYDSTVWQKAYIDGYDKYIMIAELNSVVPTFDIVADAPAMDPIIPHFDTNSTDVYYKLHQQTPWGFRVKPASKKGYDDTDSSYQDSVNISRPLVEYPSDEKTQYILNDYDPDMGENTSVAKTYDGAVYYNKAGFDVASRTISEGLEDKITIVPTGCSGNKYNSHDGANSMIVKPDILELSILLPSIGNTISKVWDIVYSEDRNRDIAWKYVEDSPNESLNGMTRDLETFAGCINSVHDLMGMIITENKPVNPTNNDYNNHYIYKDGDVYYRLAKEEQYDYTISEGVDATLGKPNGYTYEYKELVGLSEDLSTMYGLILQIKEMLGNDLTDTRDRNTVAGSLNTLNDLIELFEQKIYPIKPVITNSNGKISTADWTTAQTAEATNWGNDDVSSLGSDENKWISYNIDGINKEVQLFHTFNEVENTTTTKDVNGNGDTIITYAPIVDNMGHIVGKNTETTTLPYGFKSITPATQSEAVSNPDIDVEKIIANNTQDNLNIASSNKWIRMSGNNLSNTFSIGHEVHVMESGEANTDYGLVADKTIAQLDTENKFEVPAFKFDEAGHITKAETHTVSIPDNFTDIVITNSGANVKEAIAGITGVLEADNLTDTVTIDSANRWIVLTADAVNDKLTISHNSPTGDVNTTKIGNEEPLFGATFDIPEVKYDELGHINSVSTHTVKIPLPSLTEGDNAQKTTSSVITGLSLSQEEGKFIASYDDVGNRILVNYAQGTNAEVVKATDSVNGAFAKLQNQVNNEASRAQGEESKLNTAVSTEKARAEGAENALQENISAEESRATTAENALTSRINGLDVEITAETNKYISSITQVDGLISATKASLPDYSAYWDRITALENTIADYDTIKSNLTNAISRISTLETKVASLETKVKALEDAQTI